MFKERLKIACKKIIEPIAWIIVTLIIMYGLYNFNWIETLFKWIFIPIGAIGGLFIAGLVLWAWIDWQFIEPYKNYKKSKK